jgi:hypothetical protein
LCDDKKIYKTINSYLGRKIGGENRGATHDEGNDSIIYPNVKMEEPLENQKINTTY